MKAAGDETEMERGGGVDSEPAPQSRIQNLSRQVDEVTDTMKGNVNGLLQRLENLVELLNKTEELKEGAEMFKKTSNNVARSYCWKNAKLIMVIVVVVVVLIVVLIVVLPESSPPAPPCLL